MFFCRATWFPGLRISDHDDNNCKDLPFHGRTVPLLNRRDRLSANDDKCFCFFGIRHARKLFAVTTRIHVHKQNYRSTRPTATGDDDRLTATADRLCSGDGGGGTLYPVDGRLSLRRARNVNPLSGGSQFALVFLQQTSRRRIYTIVPKVSFVFLFPRKRLFFANTYCKTAIRFTMTNKIFDFFFLLRPFNVLFFCTCTLSLKILKIQYFWNRYLYSF